MNIDISFLKKEMMGKSVSRPTAGTLAGHAAGEPFDKVVFALIKRKYPETTYRQFEYLNGLFLKHPQAKTVEQRFALIPIMPLAYLLNRGKTATRDWSRQHQFQAKQDDTADILVIKGGFFNIIDVKTFNKALSGQPPNIISALKLARMCALMLDTKRFDTHDITYVSVTWVEDEDHLVCTNLATKQLFKAPPVSLYINWSAALQIQFHVEHLAQDYTESIRNWCLQYLRVFVASGRRRAEHMIRTFVEPYEKYLE